MDKPVATNTLKEDEEKHSIRRTGFIVWPFVFLILYALSAGPVVIMGKKGLISHNNKFIWTYTPSEQMLCLVEQDLGLPQPSPGPLRKFYRPLEWAYNNTPLHRPLTMYFHLWDPEDFDKNGEPRQVD
jgi:hypothetical protein